MLEHTVYLLHFSPPYKAAGHYIGIARTDRLEQRFEEHKSLRGAAITSAALKNQSVLHVVRLWPNATFKFEAHLKHHSHFSLLCPMCSPHIDCRVETRYRPIVASVVAQQPDVRILSGWTAKAKP